MVGFFEAFLSIDPRTTFTFYHSGRIAVGNKGSGKIDELRMFAEERYPKIIEGKRFNLGTLVNDHLWNINQSDVIEVIANCISYVLIRDEYREYVKQIKKLDSKVKR